MIKRNLMIHFIFQMIYEIDLFPYLRYSQPKTSIIFLSEFGLIGDRSLYEI